MTQNELKELLHYNPSTGIFTRLVSTNNRVKAGDIAGTLTARGYVHFMVKGKKYYAHRLAFLYMAGEMPVQCDHINHIKDDNRWLNLRPANYKINHKNKSLASTNTSGFTGVVWHKKAKKWHATIAVDGKNIHLGIFVDINDAITARKQANIKHNFHANHGK